MDRITELREQMQKALKEARGICETVEQEGREFTADERQKVANILEEANARKAELKQAEEDERMRRQILDFGDGLDLGALGANGNGKGQNGRLPRSLGEQFVEDEQFKAWLKGVAPGGRVPERMQLTSPPIALKGGFNLFKKDLITGASDTSAGAFVTPDNTGIYEPLGRYPLTLRDLISVRQTTSDTVEFVRQTAQVTQAAVVPEANVTDYTGAPGQVSGEKPEGAMAFERVTETVKTLAVWVPATRRALSDAAQLRGLIDQELREDLAEEFENQLLNGNGSGENFTGLANTANVLVQAFDTDIITTTRKAITNLKVNGKQMPTAWVMHPNDWESIDLLKDGENRYYWGGPMAQGQKTLWGIPVVESFFATEGVAYLGNWRKMVVWDREQATITVSDSHEDFFIRNMIAILAEMRAAMGIIRPSAFVEVDLSGGS